VSNRHTHIHTDHDTSVARGRIFACHACNAADKVNTGGFPDEYQICYLLLCQLQVNMVWPILHSVFLLTVYTFPKELLQDWNNYTGFEQVLALPVTQKTVSEYRKELKALIRTRDNHWLSFLDPPADS